MLVEIYHDADMVTGGSAARKGTPAMGKLDPGKKQACLIWQSTEQQERWVFCP